MRKILQFSILFLACGGLFAQNVSLDQAVQTSAKTVETGLPKGAKAAVLTFTSTKQAFSDYIIDELATALSLSKNLQVIDRQHTDAIRREFNIQFSGDVSDEEIKSIGKQLGAQYVVTGSLVDIGNAYRFRVAAINIETAVREGSPPLNININDPQVVFLLTGQRIMQTQTPPVVSTPKPTYKIGGRGPGGGIVFELWDDGTGGKEVAQVGTAKYTDVANRANAYAGGGYNNWRNPSVDELNSMYVNLKQRNLGEFANDWYGLGHGFWNPYYLHFGNGRSRKDYPGSGNNIRVCAVRDF
jgi:TolB-like protein